MPRAVKQGEKAVVGWLKIQRGSFTALLRHQGVHTTGNGVSYNWNAELAEPLLAGLTGSWEIVFGRTIPETRTKFAADTHEHLHKLVKDVEAAVEKTRMDRFVDFSMKQQIDGYQQILKDDVSALSEKIQLAQRSAHRSTARTIREAMEDVYRRTGQFKGERRFPPPKLELRN